MPQTEVYFYRDANGQSPIFDWLLELRAADKKAFANCLAKLRLLKAFGHELRRPAADYLTDGIYELRAKHNTLQYRLLYFFHGRNIAVVAHGLTKKATVAAADINTAKESEGKSMKKTPRYTASRKAPKTSMRDGVDLLNHLIRNDRALRELTDQATLNAMVAQLIYSARTRAGITQSTLAKLIGTRQSVISRLEDADYDGHSLSMLQRIAQALGKRLEVRFVNPKSRAA